jgi:hypothetical protein
VETDAAGSIVVSRWELTPVAALLAVFVVATESANGKDFGTCIWTGEGASFELKSITCWLDYSINKSTIMAIVI